MSILSDWAIISDNTRALTHDLLMRIATVNDEKESERLHKQVRVLATTIYAPQHDDRARHMHTTSELEPLKQELRVSIKRMRDELDADTTAEKKKSQSVE